MTTNTKRFMRAKTARSMVFLALAIAAVGASCALAAFCHAGNAFADDLAAGQLTTQTVRKSIAGARVEAPDVDYTGSEVRLVPKVTFLGKVLAPFLEYSATWTNNVLPGIAKIAVFGKGAYTGAAYGSFRIRKLDISNASMADIAAQQYTGKAITPSPKITYAGKTLKAGSDYSVSYKNNVNAGTATITVVGTGIFTGNKTSSFKIAKSVQDISKASVSRIRAQTYTGKAITPSPTVRLSGRALKKGRDYQLSYASNVNAGKANVTVKGLGTYRGTKSSSFKIGPRHISKTSLSRIRSQVYTGKAITPSLSVKFADKKLKMGRDYDLSYRSNVSAGKANVTLKGKGNFTGSNAVGFTISPAPISNATIERMGQLEYRGCALKPQPKVTFGSAMLAYGRDYELAYRDNAKPGIATATVKGTGNFTGMKTASFKIVATTYTVQFEANGGKPSRGQEQRIKVGKTVKLASCELKRPGYVFQGWNTKANGKGKAYKNGQKVKNLARAGESVKLYAQWKYRGEIAAEAATRAYEGSTSKCRSAARRLVYGENDPGDKSWCSEFGMWCLYQAGARFGNGIMNKGYVRNTLHQSSGKWSYSWMHPCYYRDNPSQGEVHRAGDGYTPQPGDLIIYVNSKHGNSTNRLKDAHISGMNHTRVCVKSKNGKFTYVGTNFGHMEKGTRSNLGSAAYVIHVKWENIE